MLDVVIVGNTSVFGHFLVVRTEEDMRLVAVAQIESPHGVFEVGGALGIVESAAILVVESESATQLLVGIYGKHSSEVILTMVLLPQLLSVMLVIGE